MEGWTGSRVYKLSQEKPKSEVSLIKPNREIDENESITDEVAIEI